MTRPLQVTFRDIAPSEALEQVIRERVEWLETFDAGIVGSRVALSIPHRHHKLGRTLDIRIELSLRGEDLVVTDSQPLHATPLPPDVKEQPSGHRDMIAAIHKAFDVTRRRLEDSVRRRRGAVKVSQ